VNAAQVAGAGDVPDDDWPALAGACSGIGSAAVAQPVSRLFMSGPEASQIDHDRRLGVVFDAGLPSDTTQTSAQREPIKINKELFFLE
jgi:hypothetical protein